jgi:MtaA/CmuA family methyltransferase
LFAFSVKMELVFAQAQVEAGTDLIGLGDAAASLVGPKFYQEFIWPFEKKLVDGIHALGAAVRLHICGNTRKHLEGMGRLGCEIVDLDWMVPLAEARAAMGADQVLLGNIDPVAVLKEGTPEDIQKGLARCREEAGRAYIVGAGCEVPPDTPEENLWAMSQFAAREPSN